MWALSDIQEVSGPLGCAREGFGFFCSMGLFGYDKASFSLLLGLTRTHPHEGWGYLLNPRTMSQSPTKVRQPLTIPSDLGGSQPSSSLAF